MRIAAHPEDDRVVFRVSDTGMGIAPEHQDAIFQAFEQADGSITRQFGGTGLGLAITRRLVELHGGTIGVESQPGKGASFVFSIPKAPSGTAAPGLETGRILKTPFLAEPAFHTVPEENASGPKAPDSDAPLAEATILAIDDDPVNLRAIFRHLTAQGLTVVTADSGQGGFKASKTAPCRTWCCWTS